HQKDFSRLKRLSGFDHESGKIADLKGHKSQERQYLCSKKTGIPLINSLVVPGREERLEAFLELKNKNKRLPMRPPNKICEEKMHSRLDCNACHTAWSPQCIGCHTSFEPAAKGWDHLARKEVQGAWKEKKREFLADGPALGITKNPDGREKVSTFTPGMVLTINKGDGKGDLFKRLFSPTSSHTIVKKPRSCRSCHNNPAALGYGRGELTYEIKGGIGKWHFNPKYETRKEDGLPEDAWIGFLKNGSSANTTRSNIRSFNTEEQKKILLVGSCFQCHPEGDRKLRNAFSGQTKLSQVISKQCVLPTW
ncbi:MAG TPA: hypothetical protein VK564_09900, partial [Thermodesulfobacteriota bacterium]|nr:hypothetical protein [Thermodesulfobacteriota bacterium]